VERTSDWPIQTEQSVETAGQQFIEVHEQTFQFR
jgi:hypothetical protein